MIDSVGNVSSILVIGASNPLCLATVDRIVGPRLGHAFLLDTDGERLVNAARRVSEFGVSDIRTGVYRTDEPAAQRHLVAEAFALSDVDVAVVGPLSPPNAEAVASDPAADVRAGLLDLINCVDTCWEFFKAQGHGVLVLFTHSRVGPADEESVGYRMSMAGADVYATSLAQRAEDSGIKVIVARIDPRGARSSRNGITGKADLGEIAAVVNESVRDSKRNRASILLEFPKTIKTLGPRLLRRQ